MNKEQTKDILIEAMQELQKGRDKSNPGLASVLIFSALTGYFGLPFDNLDWTKPSNAKERRVE